MNRETGVESHSGMLLSNGKELLKYAKNMHGSQKYQAKQETSP